MSSKIVQLLCLLIAIPFLAIGQDELTLTNPSFEGPAMHSTLPYGWEDCGHYDESPPDTQPNAFSVTKPAANKNTYLGLVTRDNDTHEAIAQALSSPMQVGECYDFSISLSRASRYISLSKVTLKEENFNGAVRFRIWGGNSPCHKKELLAETQPVDHTEWRDYEFKLYPSTGNHRYVMFEAYYKKGAFFPYNGNLLIDNASSFKKCEEEEPEPIFVSIDAKVIDKKTGEPIKGATVKLIDTGTNKSNKKTNTSSNKFKWEDVRKNTTFRLIAEHDKYFDVSRRVSTRDIRATEVLTVTLPMEAKPVEVEPTPTPPIAVVPDPPKKPSTFEREKIKKGEIIRLDSDVLYFPADSFNITTKSKPVLNELYEFLRDNPDVYIEIGGHTNGIPEHDYCDWLSKNRAKSVAEFLTQRGIKADRVQYKGYGKRLPLASDNTLAGRRKNQRVEIKILEIRNG